ncbi:MAG: 4-hydroxy-tetrahydrodipicolinate reductase [Bacteroidetes bacterium]|nr:4-hydroxy-tetrahydrodipicolinate reductase [Bacteroidota bacterium]
MKYGVFGASGRLGSEVVKLFDEKNHKLVFAYDLEDEWKNDNPDLIIDCSLPEVFKTTIEYACDLNKPLIVATTGLTEDNIELMKKHSKQFPIVQCFNFSIGIQILLKLIEMANKKLSDWDVEITETHHRFKKDKPSGTAKMIQNIFDGKEINTSSLRLGNVPGDHSVSFGGLGEVITISHRALSRRTFAEGILLSAQFVVNKKNGFYSFTDVVFGK